MIFVEGLVVSECHKERIAETFKNCMCSDVSIGIVDEYTRLHITCRVDVEVVSAACDTSAGVLTVALEVHKEEGLTCLLITYSSEPVVHMLSLLGCGDKIHGSVVPRASKSSSTVIS